MGKEVKLKGLNAEGLPVLDGGGLLLRESPGVERSTPGASVQLRV